MFILYAVGILMTVFGMLSFLSIHNVDDDDLPAPKEQMVITSILIILGGLLSFTMARATDNFIEEHFNKSQNNIIIK